MAIQMKLRRPPLVSIIGCAAFATAAMLFFLTDFMLPSVSDKSDFTCTFYVAARLIIERRLKELYPLPSDTRLTETAYNKAAHKILPDLPANVGTAQFYPPLVPLLFSPLGFLPPPVALFVFQILGIAAVALSSRLLCSGKSAEKYFFCSFLFTPLTVALWIGQSDLIIGVLPYSLMYWLLSRNRPMSAGLVASVTLLKTNLMLVPGFISVILILRHQWRMFAGLCAGGAVIILLNLLIFGPSVCSGWIVDVKLLESDFLNPTTGAARHLAASLPRVLLFLAPREQAGTVRIMLWISSAIFGLIGLAACRKLTQNSKDDLNTVSIAVVLSSCLLPLCAPYFLYYSFSVLIVAGMLVFSGSASDPSWSSFIKPRVLALWIIMSIYPFLLIFSTNQVMPLIAVIPFIIVFVDIVRFSWNRSVPQPTASPGQ